ncbi:MAG: tetratricopeptide repeat protein [Cyclobacteriaceae bacterium]|nr:tetratricopeptide repeat protein [Cyclobacteriaceae bacterium]
MKSGCSPFVPVSLLIVILCVATGVNAQQSKIDSLRSMVSSTSDTVRITALNNLAYEVVFSDPVEAQEIANQSIDESTELEYAKGLLGGYRVLGISHDLRSEYVQAIDAYKKAMPIALQLNDPAQTASVQNVLGVAYYHLSQYNVALEYFLDALKLTEKTGKPRYLANIYTNIGLVYHDQNDLDKALDYYEKALVYGEQAYDLRMMGRVSNNIGIILNTKGLYDGARIYYEQSLNYKSKVNDEIGASATQQNLAVVYKNLGNLGKANELLQQSRKTKEEAGDLMGLIQVFDTQIGIWISQKKFAEAMDLLKKSEEILEQINSKEPYINLFHRYKEYYYARGQYDISEQWQEKKDSIREVLFNETKSNQLATLQSVYELDKKETEIKLLQNERDNQALQRDIVLILLIGGVIVVIIIGVWFYQRQRQQKAMFAAQQKLHDAEIQNAQLRESELKRELEYKNRELTSYTINFVQKGQLFEELKENIASLMNSSESDVAMKLNPLKKVVDSNYQIDKEWDDFKLRFEEVHAGFFEQLKAEYPELSNSDLRLCSLLRLNMTMKESAKILGISTDSVKTSRYRLRKKLNLDRDENLTDFIMRFGTVGATLN